MASYMIGSTVSGYRLEEQIGRGGMGVVYRATHIALDKQVALKLIAEELGDDEGFRERFRREPRLAASIDHPNVIPVYDAGEADEQLFVAMRLVEGSDLRTIVAAEGKLEPERAAQIVSQVGAALDAAHELGLVHRDVKPGNVLIERRGNHEHVYLTDFGLTKGGEGSATLTRTGQWVGTPDYVAPEQIHGGTLDRRTDVYALGAVLYDALAGQPPYGRETEVAKIYAHLSKPPPSLPDDVKEASPALEDVIQRAMAKEPTERYGSAGELGRDALAAAGETQPSPTAAATAAAATAAAAAARSPTAPGETAPGPTAPGETAVAGAGTKSAKRPPPPVRGTAAAGAGAAGAGGTPPAPTRVLPHGLMKNRAVLAGLGAAALVLLGAGGYALGSSGGGEEAPSLSNSTSAGTLGLEFPDGWDRAEAAASVPGIEFRDPISLASQDGGVGLVAGQVDAGGPSLLPSGFVQSVGGAPPRDDAVQLGGDLQAYRYGDLQPNGVEGEVTMFVAPTSAGVATLACTVPIGASSSALDECEQIAGTLSLTGPTAFALGPDPAYAKALDSAIGELDKAVATRSKQLGEAKTPDAQAASLDQIAGAYSSAAGALSKLKVSPAVQPANAAMIDSLNATAASYGEMASAADSGDEGAYNDAKDAVGRAENQVQKALGLLGEAGYEVA